MKRNKEKITSDQQWMTEDLDITKPEICLADTILKLCPSITFLDSRNTVILKLIFCENPGKTSIKFSFTRAKALWQTFGRLFLLIPLYMAL